MLAVQLFRANFTASPGAPFFSLRGDGGDGGVEAYFDTPTGKVGVQAKYFFSLGSSEFNQIKGSLATALANHPTLTEYVIYIPFDLTGPVAAGNRGLSEVERFEAWRVAEQDSAAAAGNTLTITLCSAATIISQFSALDKHGGMRRYWFDTQTLTTSHIGQLLTEAERYAGPRYMAALDIATSAHRGLDFFGGTGDYASWYKETIVPQKESLTELYSKKLGALDVLTASENEAATRQLLTVIENLKLLKEDVTSAIGENTAQEIEKLIPILKKAERIHKKTFDKTHGKEKDTPGFRQFSAEYMVSFPAEQMDTARQFISTVVSIQKDMASIECRAGSVQSLLLRGPAGIGKTHAIVSAAMRRFAKGGMSLISFGDDFENGEPWEVLRSKVGLGTHISRDELYGCFQACADSSGLPFVIYIDALNEIVDKHRWRKNLPQLLQQLKPYPGIKLCVSTRDIYLAKVIDKTFPGFSFEHSGFAGNEYEALEGFAAFYHLDQEITPLFSKELNNPLFLHLACKALVAEGRRTLDMSLPGFKSLIDSHLEECDRKIRDHHDYVNRKNLTRAAMLALSKTLVEALPRNRTWDACIAVVKGLVGSEFTPESFLHLLELENLIILTQDDNDETSVRLGYQRYGDTMRAIQLIEDCSDNGKFDFDAMAGRLTSFIRQDVGVLDAVAVVLPEMQKLEITHARLKLPKAVAYSSYVRSLIWRSRDSFDAETDVRMREALQESDWKSVYEALFSLSLVPQHQLNAENWFSYFLTMQKMVDRDVFLNLSASSSFDGFGAARSLIISALKAKLTLWPDESRVLALCALGWLTSCSDRRVRDLSSKGITRIISQFPTLAANAVGFFKDSDDDYIKEAISLSVYSACLLEEKQRSDYIPALNSMVNSRWIDSPNVHIRESVQLLADVLAADGLIPNAEIAGPNSRLKHALPAPWPTIDDTKPLFDIKEVPSNMRLIGRGLAPDFMRYQVESKISDFNLQAAGIKHENIGAWIVTETLRMGYPGRKKNTLTADRIIMSESGSGRGKDTYKERLGKKYYWIALHRLIGILADNVPIVCRYSESKLSPNRLWSVDSRKVDLTDVRDLSTGAVYPDEVIRGPRYAFPPIASTMKEWVINDDFSPHADCLIRRSDDGTEWIPLWISVRDNDREDSEWSNPYLTVDIFYRSVFVAKDISKGDLSRLERVADSTCNPYRGFFAEYPRGEAFTQLSTEGYMDLGGDGLSIGIVSLLRGGEWEYDFSCEERPGNLDVPIPDFIEKLELKWDKQRGWIDRENKLCAFHTVSPKRDALFVKREALNLYLQMTKQHLMFFNYRNKGFIVQTSGDSEQIDRNAFLLYQLAAEPRIARQSEQRYNC